MAQITYQNAIDENGNCIHISKVEPENHRGRIFHCLSCGREMIAKIGDPNKAHSKSSHFAHKIEGNCNKETYLHKLGKMLFKKRFETGDPINIICPTYKVCPDSKKCVLYDKEVCRAERYDKFNIRKWYDKCTEEKDYNGYIADLLLESTTNPEREPIFIEIVYSHKCSEQKIQSKNKIIEIYVSDEYQLTEVINGDFKTDNTAHLYNFELKETGVLSQGSRNLEYFVLFASGKAFVKSIPCRDVKNINNQNTDIEFAIYKPWSNLGSPVTAYDIGFLLASDAGCDVRNCAFCKYHSLENYGLGLGLYPNYQLFCRLTYTQDTPSHPQQTEAKTCQYFRVNKEKVAETRKMMSKIKYWELPLAHA